MKIYAILKHERNGAVLLHAAYAQKDVAQEQLTILANVYKNRGAIKTKVVDLELCECVLNDTISTINVRG